MEKERERERERVPYDTKMAAYGITYILEI
jgi:hypothetical protein